MNLRAFLANLEQTGDLRNIQEAVSPTFDVARLIYKYDGNALLFDNLQDFPGWRMAAGITARRDLLARALGCETEELVYKMAEAASNPQPVEIVENAACQEVVLENPDLTRIPIPRYHPEDGGPYITAGVTVIHDPDYGRNISFHRWMRLDSQHLVGRIVEKRGTATALSKSPEGLPIAICLGVPPQVLLAAAMSPPKGVDEMTIAQAMATTPITQCLSVPLEVPAEAELVLEGILTHEQNTEGPFPDLTGTMDGIRQQPTFVVKKVTHRHNPIFHALLPAGLEHKNLMGMPREPTIYAEVNKVVKCTGVRITPGGCSWLHAVVQIEKQGPDDGPKAIEAAFRGHTSLKHVVVVDNDINIYNMADVEWAIATRTQAETDLYIFYNQPSSSLDPSARQVPGEKARTSKIGLDATIPWGQPKAGYKRISY
ncbi:MAG: UbiD family decarboxylase [Anaerolineae bacterium]|nr:UbiD family decarboxylase [Anaerolineae bacterium]